MFPIVSGVAMGQGSAALSITLNTEGLDPIELIAPAGAHPLDTAEGQIDVTASAAGGDGSYSYAWTLSENGTDSGNVLSVLSAGTQNVAQYNDLTLQGNASPGSPHNITVPLTCRVTDGTGATADVSIGQPVTVLAL